jgi:hypothetical protein
VSIQTTERVWQFSRTRGNELLVLLALADGADEWGVAHFRDELLASRCRVSLVELREILTRLEREGEIIRRGNRLVITAGLSREEAERGLHRWEVRDER